MKKIASLVIILMLFASCMPHTEVKGLPQETRIIPIPPPEIKPQSMPVPKRYKTGLACEENTSVVFNRSGIEILPFVRLSFFDMDNDGRQELIAGAKDGSLRLYRRERSGPDQKWVLVSGYFDGIKVGAFSSPAVADIDLDGKPEVVVGTGGFSSESGRVMIFKNAGTSDKPIWQRVDMPLIDVGDDATPALIDVNGDRKPDLIVGNSTGALMYYRNTSIQTAVSFTREPDFFRGVNVGMYGMPATTMSNGRIIIIAGNSMGKLYLLEKKNGTSSWQKSGLKMEFSNFAAPAFMQDSDDPVPNLVVSDGNGQIHYYRNAKADYRHWEELSTFFAGRLMPGPACSPTMAELGSKSCMVTGNINGEMKLFEFQPHAEVLPWAEKPNFFKSIKLSGYARGTVVSWRGRYLLITGQQDGYVRAFLNTGSEENPAWNEQKNFFRGVPKTFHASPTVFDLDGDGMWELVVGDVDGNVTAYRMDTAESDKPHWTKIEDVFSEVKTGRYASPSLVRDDDRIFLLVGQQDGGIRFYSAKSAGRGMPVFSREDFLSGLMVNSHSAPSVFMNKGVMELSVGDYNGNLRHFACRKDSVEVQ
ncbi:MAG: VCBS repeat-containing protein [Nitrospirae bacterium]|nr:VCBS repeat-containing protein [Nitrospirota bacterium]